MSDDNRARDAFAKEAAAASAAIAAIFENYEAAGANRTTLRVAAIGQAANDLAGFLTPSSAAQTCRVIANQIAPSVSAPRAGNDPTAAINLKIAGDVVRFAIAALDANDPKQARQLFVALTTKRLPPNDRTVAP